MTRLTMAALLAATWGLAACGDGAGTPASAPVDARPVEVGPPATQAAAPWTLKTAADGASLRHQVDAAPGFEIACRRAPARLEAVAEGLTPIGSEDRFTLGVGDEAFALVADLEAERASGVEASGPIPADLLDRLARGQALSVSYGAQTVGPLEAVPEAERAAFVAACHEIVGSTG